MARLRNETCNSCHVQPIAFGVSLLHSQISIDNLVLYISFTTFLWKETMEIEIGYWDYMTIQMLYYGVVSCAIVIMRVELLKKRPLIHKKDLSTHNRDLSRHKRDPSTLKRELSKHKTDMCDWENVTSRTIWSWHIWMSHVTNKWVISHMNETCHVWMSHVTYGWVMSRVNASCHIHE